MVLRIFLVRNIYTYLSQPDYGLAAPKIIIKYRFILLDVMPLQRYHGTNYKKEVTLMSNTAMANTAQALMDSMTPKFAVSYLRVSTRGQAERGGGHDEGFSIPAQREGSIFCAYCGERMMVSNEKKKDGTIYPYFVCSGRHSKRRKDCTTKAVLIDVVEKEIEKIYEAYQLPPEVRILLESCIQGIISTERAKYDAELDGLKGEKAKLENKRKKLLEAHYCDAIPLDLLKSEQQKIAKELSSIEHEIKMHDTTFEQITENLKRALDIVENCGEAYKNASDTIKKLMNQAIFEKFYISNDADMEFKVDAEFRPPFDQILEPVKDDIIRINRLAQDCSSKLSYYIGIAKDHIQEIFGCGLYTINNSTNMSTYSNGSNFFSHNSSSKVLLVDLAGIEPASKNLSHVLLLS